MKEIKYPEINKRQTSNTVCLAGINRKVYNSIHSIISAAVIHLKQQPAKQVEIWLF